jgi:hypothetical protein
MNTKINLTYKGTDYTLEYDRMSVKLLENQGFSLEEFSKKPMSNIELAFTGAFIKNHRKISQTTIDEIYSKLKDKTSLIQVLSTMISECYESLMEEPDGDEGNINWEAVGLAPTKNEK